MDLDTFLNEIYSLGLPADPILDFIRTLYSAKELPYEREIKAYQTQYPYPTEILFEIDDWIVKLLQRYDLIVRGMSETTKYGEIANVRRYILTREGLELGSEVYLDHLRRFSDDLIGILEEVSINLLKMIALSAIYPGRGGFLWIEINTEGKSFEDALAGVLSDFETAVLGPEELRRIFEISKRVFGNISLVFKKMEEASIKIYEPSLYDIFMSHILVKYYDGKVHERVVRLMEDLMALGLSVKIPRFKRNGEYLWDAYVAPPELAHLLMRLSANADLSEARRLFLAANILSRELTGRLSKKELLEALSKLGISEDEVRLVTEILYE